MSKTYRYNPDTFHKDAKERHYVKRKLKQHDSEPRIVDSVLRQKPIDPYQEIDEEVWD